MTSESMFYQKRISIIEERSEDRIFTEVLNRLTSELLQTKEFQEAVRSETKKKGRTLQPEDIFDDAILKDCFMDYIQGMMPLMMFDVIVQLYQPLLYAIAMRILGNHYSAEDIVQESLMKAYVAMKSYSKERLQTLRLRPWLCTIVRNTANNYRLHESRFESLGNSEFLEIEGSRFEQPETVIIVNETEKEVRELMCRLPPRYRSLVILRFLTELDYKSIAQILSYQRLGTLKSSMHRSLQLMRKIVRDMDIHGNDLETWSQGIKHSLKGSM